ncbi:MAG: hypothetical protein AAB368_07675 [bacterium]
MTGALAWFVVRMAAAGTLDWRPLSDPGCGARGLVQAVQAGGTAYVAGMRAGRFEGIGKSVDGRKTWTLLEGPARGLPRQGTPTTAADVHCLPDMPEIAWALAGGTLFRTSDGGASWGPIGGIAGLTSFAADAANPARFFVGGAEGIYLCTDGLSLQLMPDSPKAADRLVLAPGPVFMLYVVRWGKSPGGLIRNVGRSWVTVRADPAIADIAVDARDPRRLAVLTREGAGTGPATGVWVTRDGGKTWIQANAGLTVRGGNTIRFDPRDPDRLILVTEGHGCFGARWPPDRARGPARRPVSSSSGGGS